MANIIKTKFSAVTAQPVSLAVGELAYSDSSDTLWIGDNTGTPVAIGGAVAFTKLAGIEAGAQVNTVASVAGKTGTVTLVIGDISGLQSALDGKADDGDLASYLGLAGGTMSGFITLHSDPTIPSHAATKQYVDNMALGLDFKESVLAASTANITLSGAQTVDGVALVAGNRVLVKNQTAPAENGIYIVSASAWSRAPDADTTAEVSKGMFAFVEGGTANGGSAWVATSTGVLGTDAVTFTQFGGGQTYTASTGITLTGNAFSVTDYANIVFNSSTIDGGSF